VVLAQMFIWRTCGGLLIFVRVSLFLCIHCPMLPIVLLGGCGAGNW
jgi:hypothetical protein